MSEFGIGEVSAATGLSRDTLRYYERAGLVPGVLRDGGGRRRYSASQVEWIRLLDLLRATGLSIAQARKFLGIVAAGEPGIPARIEFLETHRTRLFREIELRKQAIDLIDYKIGANRRLLQGDDDE